MSLADNIAATLANLGQQQGQSAFAQGQIRAQGIQNAAQINAQAGQNNLGLVTHLIDSLSQIPAQMQAQKRQGLQDQVLGAQLQGHQQENDARTQAMAAQKAANQVIASLPRSADGTYDTGALLQKLAAQNVPLQAQEALAKSIDGVNGVIASFNKSKVEHAADLADFLLKQHGTGDPVTPDSVHLGLGVAQAVGLASPEEVQHFVDLLGRGADPKTVLEGVRGLGSKHQDKPVVLGEGASLVNPETGAAVATNAPKPVSLAEGATLVNPQTGAVVANGAPKTTAPKSLQSENFLLDGKPVKGTFDPGSGKYLYQGQDVTDRVKPIPPASAGGPEVFGGAAGAAVPSVAPGQVNDAYLKTLPTGQQATVKALAEGRQSFPTGAALRSSYWQGMLDAVAKYDPSFDAINYNARASTRKAFTSGPESKQANALNTVIGHLSELAGLGDKLDNSGYNFINSARNMLTAGGSDRGRTINSFELAKNAVADELTRVYRQAGGTEQDIQAWKSTIGAAKSPGELKDAWKTIGGLLESKLEALQTQYEKGMGTAANAGALLTPKAQAGLAKLKGESGASAPAAPAPKVGAKIGRFEIVGVN